MQGKATLELDVDVRNNAMKDAGKLEVLRQAMQSGTK
jgi:hypothetical protein